MPATTWEEVLKRDDLIGGDIESVEEGVVYRGPLSVLSESDGLIVFKSPWFARLNPSTNQWEKWHIASGFVSKNATKPIDIGEGRVHCTVPMSGGFTIFPKGGSRLDPRKVKGLELGTDEE